MPIIKKIKIMFIAAFLSLNLAAVWLVSPVTAIPGEESPNWALIEAFSQSMRDSQDNSREYWWVYAILLLLLAGFFTYLALTKNKIERNRVRFAFSQEEPDGSNKRGLMRMAIEQEMYYARVGENTYRKVKLINLSGGGLLFASSTKFQQNEELKIVMELFPDDIIRIRARVVRVTEKSDKSDKEPYLLGLQFEKISKSVQDKIIKRILRDQQGYVMEEKRRAKNVCIFCGEPLPEGTRGGKAYCSKCIDDSEVGS